MMIFRQIISKSGGCATYIFGCTQAGELFVVDPRYEMVDEIVRLAQDLGNMKIAYIIDTHTHADHLSGVKKLQALTNANIYYHEESQVKFKVERIKDGEEIKAGNVKIKVIHTPGHTPDSISVLVYDKRRDESWNEPWAVLTGDTLFVGGVGRIDIGGENAEENLYYSLAKLKGLPDYVEIYPTHTAGSVCGVGISGKPSSTIGFEKRFNTLFRINEKDEFINRVREVKISKPKEFDEYIRKNLEGVI
ncbi:beta-lactamase domain protein [Sulfolobus islandicus Y.N.15.51]|jgi:Zn-dependent hydrolases, including glyoxylases|uniref:Beta-lactamase domain protein n=2 Tax=Saccharolobus islandicus TaxID=43080 RepID=C3NK95_SACI1|nr:MBL fold metallo-hydrolase [Sulfolobus islandicus]ACP49338.1 beta-lactamase domain protein [Sulfolobus islandicus Y.N.15.51]ADX81969.1 beta-lactamase domain protein [Sulfolobus islandicus HVE10/4]WCM36688.1 MBL fold metallo-hydrolase [Sulfolobus islandicus]